MAVQNYGTGGTFQVSPGVSVSEIDLTTIVPTTTTTTGAIAGVFRWGPVGQRVLVSSEDQLVANFGKPTDINPETFFTAANFLSYSNALYVSRAANTASSFSAIANTSVFSANAAHTVLNSDDYLVKSSGFDPSVRFIAKCPGDLGNSLQVSVCDTAAQYSSNVAIGSAASNTMFNSANTQVALTVGSNTVTFTLANTAVLANNTPLPYATTVQGMFNVGDYIVVGNNSIGRQSIQISSIGAITVANTAGTNTGYASFTFNLTQPLKLSTNIVANTINRQWQYAGQIGVAPGQTPYVAASGNTAANDAMHIVVADQDGIFTGSPGSVLEIFSNVSRATDAKNTDGTTNYYKNIINNSSQYLWTASESSNAVSALATSIASSTNLAPTTISLQGGTDTTETGVSFADVANAYNQFASAEDVDISLVMTGKSWGGINGEQLGNYLIDNIATVRKDCLVFVSPTYSAVVNQGLATVQNVVTFRSLLRSSSYGVLDSGYKYQYDKYNDIYRWIPLNGDIAGLCAYTDGVRDPWYSPAGYSRGNIKNVIKLAYNPNGTDRDVLYTNNINPVVTQPGQGTVLFGDKTLQANASAFDRINVRRLFIVLEKTIATAAKSLLFEFNDVFTRAQFVNMIDPFLRNVLGRRGITDYRIVCDTTNNTPQVIDSNSFVGDIWIKPNRSINYIQLNFTAVGTGVSFTTIAG